MPGSVLNAAPSSVLPWSLCVSFGRSQSFTVLINVYRNGESQRSRLVDTSRKVWKTSRRLTPSQLLEFQNFYDACKGPLTPFYFYDPWETTPKFSYDPTGVSVYGRYPVRFEGPWEQSVGLARADVEITLVQLA